MNERDYEILTACIEEHVGSAAPVASGTIAEKYELGLSAATVRTVMNRLEEEGYLTSPHTSAGRVPTEQAYRWYVGRSLETRRLPSSRERELLDRRFREAGDAPRLAMEVARLLAEMMRLVTVSRSAGETQIYGLANIFRQPEFRASLRAAEIAEVIERIDELVRELPERGGLQVYVGRETPVGRAVDYSLIVRRVRTPWGDDALIGMLGPVRMPYPRAISLLDYSTKLMEERTDG